MVAGPLRPLRLRPPSPAPRYQPLVPVPSPRAAPEIPGPPAVVHRCPHPRRVSTPARDIMYVYPRFRYRRRAGGSKEATSPLATPEKRFCRPWRAFSILRDRRSTSPTWRIERRVERMKKGGRNENVVLRGASVTQKIKASSSSSS